MSAPVTIEVILPASSVALSVVSPAATISCTLTLPPASAAASVEVASDTSWTVTAISPGGPPAQFVILPSSGLDGLPGDDAAVTMENIVAALGYTPLPDDDYRLADERVPSNTGLAGKFGALQKGSPNDADWICGINQEMPYRGTPFRLPWSNLKSFFAPANHSHADSPELTTAINMLLLGL